MNQSPRAGRQTTPFFAISTFKFLVLYVVTMGFYEIYWFYRHWEQIKHREGSNIQPILRSLFGILFSYSLFARIQRAQIAEKHPSPLIAWLWCFVLVAFNATVVLGGTLQLLSFFSIIPLLVVQANVNQLNQASQPVAEKNDQFSQLEQMIIAAGCLLWLTNLLA